MMSQVELDALLDGAEDWDWDDMEAEATAPAAPKETRPVRLIFAVLVSALLTFLVTDRPTTC